MKRLLIFVLFFNVLEISAQGLDFSKKDFNADNNRYLNHLCNLSSYNSQSLFTGSDDKKSVSLAVVLSLLLPGMGELYVGDYSTGRYLTAADGALWITYASFELYGTWLRDDARKFATTNAGVNLSGQDNQFFVDIGNYKDVYYYNERKLQERQDNKLYDPNSSYFWSWNDDQNRQEYKKLRISSDQAFNSKQYVVAAVIINHIVSAINAARLAISHNSQNESLQSFRFDTKLLGSVNNPH
jgi:hypothetical protein